MLFERLHFYRCFDSPLFFSSFPFSLSVVLRQHSPVLTALAADHQRGVRTPQPEAATLRFRVVLTPQLIYSLRVYLFTASP